MTRTLALALLAFAALPPSLAEAQEFEKTCAYALAEHGTEKKTDCSVSWRNPATGKIYCFSTEQTKQLFLQDPEENIRKAEDVFAKLRKKQ